MASDVQREFFMSPNPYVWDQDMAELRRAGFNMLRTGWWTAWDQVMKESGVVHEEMLRALEAFLMTAPLSFIDRKSTRLNSSHGYISYAVFCLKKKKKKS